MYPIPDDILKYVILEFLLPKDLLSLSIVSKYDYKQLTYKYYKFHYFNHAKLICKLFKELLSHKKCVAYMDSTNFKCIKNRNYNSSFCSRHEKMWYEDETTDVWWVPLQM